MTTTYGASDLRQSLQLSGVPVVVGLVTANGLENVVDHSQLRGELVGNISASDRTVLVETGVFALATGGDISVDGVALKIKGWGPIDDGGFTLVAVGSVV